MDPSHLHRAELQYELNIREIDFQAGSGRSNEAQLRRKLVAEARGEAETPLLSTFDPRTELEASEATLLDLKYLTSPLYGGVAIPIELISRALHVDGRLRRIQCGTPVMGETRRRLLDEVAKLMQKLDLLHVEYEKSGIGGTKRKNVDRVPKRASEGGTAAIGSEEIPNGGRTANTTDPGRGAAVSGTDIPVFANQTTRPIPNVIDLDERTKALTAPGTQGNNIRLSPTAQLSRVHSTPQGVRTNTRASVGSSQGTAWNFPEESLNNLNIARHEPRPELNRATSPYLEELSDQENRRPEERNEVSARLEEEPLSGTFSPEFHRIVEGHNLRGQLRSEIRVDNVLGTGRAVAGGPGMQGRSAAPNMGRGGSSCNQGPISAAALRSVTHIPEQSAYVSRIPSPVAQAGRWRRGSPTGDLREEERQSLAYRILNRVSESELPLIDTHSHPVDRQSWRNLASSGRSLSVPSENFPRERNDQFDPPRERYYYNRADTDFSGRYDRLDNHITNGHPVNIRGGDPYGRDNFYQRGSTRNVRWADEYPERSPEMGPLLPYRGEYTARSLSELGPSYAGYSAPPEPGRFDSFRNQVPIAPVMEDLADRWSSQCQIQNRPRGYPESNVERENRRSDDIRDRPIWSEREDIRSGVRWGGMRSGRYPYGPSEFRIEREDDWLSGRPYVSSNRSMEYERGDAFRREFGSDRPRSGNFDHNSQGAFIFDYPESRSRGGYRGRYEGVSRTGLPIARWKILYSGDAPSRANEVNIHDFLDLCRIYSRSENVSEQALLQQVIHLLTGRARAWFQNDPFLGTVRENAQIKIPSRRL